MSTASSGKLARRNAVRRPQRSGSPDIGALLKRARESRGLSLAEVRDRTGIKWEHLEALEATDFASLPDEPTVMTATRRYAEVLHLDASDVCARMLRSWQEANRRAAAAAAATSPSGSSGTGTKPKRRAATFSSRPAPGVIGENAPAGPPGQRPDGPDRHLRAFTQTAEIPALGATAAPPTTISVHFDDTGATPVTRRSDNARRSPRWLKWIVATVALLLAVAVAGAVVQHYRPKWLADIHLTRHSPASPSPSTQPAAARTSRGRHTARGQEGSSSQLVSTTGTGAGTESVVVRSGDYAVVVDAREPCWIEATGPPGGSGPVFAGVVQAGQTKVLDPVAGRLTVQFGASLVTVQVEVAGKAVNGWSFSPKTVPFTLSFASSPSF